MFEFLFVGGADWGASADGCREPGQEKHKLNMIILQATYRMAP
jgi:hypothetical protein